MELNDFERIDDLQFKGLKIIQDTNGFCFGIDAVLLSDFAKISENADYIVDLCSGNGIVAILLSAKTNATKIDAIEIQENVANLAKRNIELNLLNKKINVINRDLNNLKDLIPSGSVDAVTVNPPYKAKNSGIINDTDSKTIARHEISCTLDDIIKEASRILKSGANFYMVHRVERLVDICTVMRKYNLEPKRIKFVHPNFLAAPNLVLIQGVRSAKPFLIIEKPLYVYDEDGNYTKDILTIYNRKE